MTAAVRGNLAEVTVERGLDRISTAGASRASAMLAQLVRCNAPWRGPSSPNTFFDAKRARERIDRGRGVAHLLAADGESE